MQGVEQLLCSSSPYDASLFQAAMYDSECV
jgi:hypothetical protein